MQTNLLLINMVLQERMFLEKYFTQTTVSAPVNLNEGDNTDHAVQSKLFSSEECYKNQHSRLQSPSKTLSLGFLQSSMYSHSCKELDS